MRHIFALVAVVGLAGSSQAAGLLIPVEKSLPPLAMLDHRVTVAIDEQVAITNIEQTFRNHTDRNLEATYILPIPKGASVRRFSMWIAGKEVPGELVEADKARKIYTDIVQRTLDPGLLEYMGNNLLKLRVFPVPPRADQKISISYTSIASSENGLVEYTYPMKTSGKAASTLEKFTLNVNLKSQHPLQNLYSPTHAITIARANDRQAVIGFEKDQALLDKDFQLFYTIGTKDVGLNTLTHRPTSGQNGYFMLLISPRAELSKSQQVPRDMVFVLDTSGSMRGQRMTQARNALKYCLTNLTDNDRFAVMNFATTVNRYSTSLLAASRDNVEAARKWVDALEATGGTAINDALAAALDMRSDDPARTCTIVFFTDGLPTVGETNAEKILQNVAKKNSANTRIFTFGVGDTVNASMLDALADSSRAVSTYVRESEDIEAKVSGLYGKISNPVLANLKLNVSDNVKLTEIYPPQLPDLFHGSQLVVLGRYDGSGKATIRLTGNVGSERKDFEYDVAFADKTPEDKPFVEDLWARRKVGYLLDQIRVNGEKKELVDEVITLAKRYGITTQYTSYLVVPDGVAPVVRGPEGRPMPNVRFAPEAKAAPPALFGSFQGGGGPVPGAAPMPVAEFARNAQKKAGDGAKARAERTDRELEKVTATTAKADASLAPLAAAKEQLQNYRQARDELRRGNLGNVQSGKLGVDLSLDSNNLRNQTVLGQNAQRRVGSCNLLDIGGVWIDEKYEASQKTVTVKAMSPAYFRILEKQPTMRDVLRLGNHLVWVTPSNTALVIDMSTGAEQISDAEIDRLFTATK